MIENYISELQDVLGKINIRQIKDVVDVLHEARLKQKNIFVMGNGGSASTASHMVCDISKNTFSKALPDIRIRELANNTAVLTAYANDINYNQAFAYHLETFFNPQDIAIGISTSGKSPNILKAIGFTNLNGGITIGLTGFDGGKLKDLVDYNIHVPSNNIGIVEDCHLVINHIITNGLKELVINYLKNN